MAIPREHMTRCEPIRDGAWLYKGVLTQDECEELQRLSVKQGLADYHADERLRVMERTMHDEWAQAQL